jgi:hypothetical protein
MRVASRVNVEMVLASHYLTRAKPTNFSPHSVSAAEKKIDVRG